ncbi:MAG: hypothetical protein A2139_14165 [Desulfobacca sp. RBG_16_60_12]|nr:MAG: hypothetical protein A2139_14165 [Desulfobacca sp. RBG_16_60_12]
MLIYDCEIEKAILGRGEVPIEGIEYCKGWSDFKGMGISCICAYNYNDDRYRVFCRDNFDEFQALVNAHDIIVGFNSLAFDNLLCAAHGLTIPPDKSYDILVEVWRAAGLGPKFEYPSHAGFGLDAICKANFELNKTGHGSHAPVLWQQGKIGQVIDYCLQDVRLTHRLLDWIDLGCPIRDPRNREKTLKVNTTGVKRFIFSPKKTYTGPTGG